MGIIFIFQLLDIITRQLLFHLYILIILPRYCLLDKKWNTMLFWNSALNFELRLFLSKLISYCWNVKRSIFIMFCWLHKLLDIICVVLYFLLESIISLGVKFGLLKGQRPVEPWGIRCICPLPKYAPDEIQNSMFLPLMKKAFVEGIEGRCQN